MKLVMVAGFYPRVEHHLRQRFGSHFDNRSIIWTPQIADHREADAKHFKWAFFDRLAAGAKDILVLLAVFRGREYIKDTLLAIAREGYARVPEIQVEFIEFDDARLYDPVCNSIEGFNLPIPVISVPEIWDLRQIDQWADRELKGKLLLHPRAMRGARRSKFQDPGLIFKSLSILGDEYRDLRINGAQQHGLALESSLNALDLHITEAISPASAGRYGDDYYVYYPPGQLRTKELLTHHVKKGNDRDERTCLRVYFFWDAGAKRVVVGWLPSHLDIASS
jgi:hypothetical protein